VFFFVAGVSAQEISTSTLTGTVTDPQGAAIIGAKIHVVDDATGTPYDADSLSEGRFTITGMRSGTYTVTVTQTGFKKQVFKNVQLIIGQTYDLKAKLELGEVTATVEVQAGREVLETTTTQMNSTITGKAITELPFTSRDALDLAVLTPGVQTTGRPRASSVEGLPVGAINITYDGINAQDNTIKSSDGFFTEIRPRVDAVQEFSITTASNSADANSEGAVQIKFVSVRGGNSFHGGGWEYLRNDYFNANYYFNNLNGLTRQIERLNEFGFKVGGPIIKDKLFFFVDTDFYKFPQSLTSNGQTLLTPGAAAGKFQYAPVDSTGANCTPGGPGCAPLAPNAWTTCSATPITNAANGSCTVDLIALGHNNGGPSAVDTTVAGIFAAMQSSVTAPGVHLVAPTNLYNQTISFNNTVKNTRYFPDLRVDWNITKNDTFEFDYHYSFFLASPDTLNGFQQTFPVAPFNKNIGSQLSNRNLFVGAWRHNIGSNKTNEVRFGVQSSPLSFFPDLNLNTYPTISSNLGSLRVLPDVTGGAGLVTNPFLGYATQGRNAALAQLIDTFSWAKGAHSINIGFNWTESIFNSFNAGELVGSLGLGLDISDPLNGAFNGGASGGACTGNIPCINSNDLGTAQALWGVLAGRVTSYSGSVNVDASKRAFVPNHNFFDKIRQQEYGLYVSDSWKVRPSVTFNYGLRWERQGTPYDLLNEDFNIAGGYSGLFGVSGLNNLFKPGTMTGSTPVFQLNGTKAWHSTDLHDFAPSVGVAWQPGFENSWLKKMMGETGKTVIRAGYSIAYTREDIAQFTSIAEANPGVSGSLFTNAQSCGGSCPVGQFQGGTVALQSANITTIAQSPTSFVTSFPLDPTAGQSVNAFAPNLRVPRVQSWSFGIQRELNPSMVMEIRYVGNHSTGLWRQDNINEVNIFENGFLQEFKNALTNLNICNANAAACVAAAGDSAGSTRRYFSDLGLAGQVPVPILSAAFTGSTSGAQNNSFFRNGTFTSDLTNGLAGSLASSIASNFSFNCNFAGTAAYPAGDCPSGIGGSYPKNFFVVNPDVNFNGAGTFRYFNGSQSTYNGLVVELRRRPAKGLTLSANYTFSKSLTDFFGNNGVKFSDYVTLRNPSLSKGVSPYDIRHAFKMESLYDFPFGAGRKWSSNSGMVNRFIGGWALNTIFRWQSGRVAQITGGLGGTFNGNDGGVQLTGITRQQLQSQLGVYKTPTPAPGAVWYIPQALLSSSGRANPAFWSACTTPGAFCGTSFYLYGPQFIRADMTISKTTKITERVSFEIRAEALNAFNYPNWLWRGSASSVGGATSARSTSIGRITSAYQDFSTTDDPGGRILQLVGRINF